MTDAEFDELKKRVCASMERWKDILPLGLWKITPHFYRDGWEKDGKKTDAVAECEANWTYLTAAVKWNFLELDPGTPDERIDHYVVHEYCHILLDCLTRYARGEYSGAYIDAAQVEWSTSMVALAIQFAFDAGKEAAICPAS